MKCTDTSFPYLQLLLYFLFLLSCKNLVHLKSECDAKLICWKSWLKHNVVLGGTFCLILKQQLKINLILSLRFSQWNSEIHFRRQTIGQKRTLKNSSRCFLTFKLDCCLVIHSREIRNYFTNTLIRMAVRHNKIYNGQHRIEHLICLYVFNRFPMYSKLIVTNM